MPHLTRADVEAFGPTVEVAVGPSASRVKALGREGEALVLPVVARALLDTGAKTTCIDLSLVKELGLIPTGKIGLTMPSAGSLSITVPVFDAEIQILGPPHVRVAPSLPVAGMDLSGLGIRLLLGRDILARCLLFYNGPMDQFTFSF